MPIIDCGFLDDDRRPDHIALLNYGPTCQVVVTGIQGDGDSADEDDSSKSVHALIDTGATLSCIDEGLAQELGLPVVDVQPIAGVAGVQDHNVYMGMVIIPGLEFNQYGRFTGVGMAEQGHKVLLGRSFLSHCIMVYDGLRGQVTIASTRAR